MKFPFLLDDRYHVERVFADSGGMGIIYFARDTRCADNPVLVKTTRYDSGPRARNLRYTLQEGVEFITKTRKILEWERKVLVRFRNEGIPNIPSANHWVLAKSTTLDASYEGRVGAWSVPEEVLNTEPYLVMEMISGAPLESRMVEPDFRANLEENLLTLSREILTILIRMHRPTQIGSSRGIFLYQDLKPANVIVSGDDYFSLIDFGATILKLGEKTTEPTAGCITPGYSAPEAGNGREAYIDERFDIYTLGATLWHAITLEDPRMKGEFPVLDPEICLKHGCSVNFAAILRRALARRSDDRYASAAAMRKDVMEELRRLRA